MAQISTQRFSTQRWLLVFLVILPVLPTVAAANGEKSICAPADFEDAICYQADTAKWDRLQATAGILPRGADPSVDPPFCTGVLISPRNLLLTSSQCLATAADCNAAEIVFGYAREACGTGPANDEWQTFRCAEIVATSPFDRCEADAGALGYTLIRLEGEPVSLFGYVDPTDTLPLSGDSLYIPQHSGGRPLEIVHGGGLDVTVTGTTLFYTGTLDTEPGSEGAPIFRDADDALVGLHHCGGCTTIGNRGVAQTVIRPEIEAHLCSPDPLLEPAPGELQEIAGNHDETLDPGETWSLLPRLRNVACAGDALGVSATLTLGAGSVAATLGDGAMTFGNLPAGLPGTADEPLIFTIAPEAPCGGTLQLDLVSITSGDGTFPDTAAYLSLSLGQQPESLLLDEDFDAGLTGWTVIDGGEGAGPASTWTTTNPGARSFLDEPFVIADSDAHGPFAMDEILVTPLLDASAAEEVSLEFEHVFERFSEGGDELAEVEVRSAATSGVWVNVATFEAASTAGAVHLDLTSQAAGATDLEIRFRYSQADFDFWWALDDVEVVGREAAVCTLYDPLFTDGFESGDTTTWSFTTP